MLQLKSWNYEQFSMSITLYRVNPVYLFYCVHNSTTSTQSVGYQPMHNLQILSHSSAKGFASSIHLFRKRLYYVMLVILQVLGVIGCPKICNSNLILMLIKPI